MQDSTDPFTNSHTALVTTVLGTVPLAELGVTDAHNHVWIEPVRGAVDDSPVLNQYNGILAELEDYHKAGGSAILDCQPGGCGRNAVILADLSLTSGVTLVCSTGFHRKRYYPPDYWLWNASPEEAADYFTAELTESVEETRSQPFKVKAGFIKIACEASLADTPMNLLQGAAMAAAATKTALEVHTERGAGAETILEYFLSRGVVADQVVLCHLDKRPDIGLHTELIQAGALLEYDTFYRPKYDPETNLWPLIEKMANAELDHGIALATDMAESSTWAHLGGGPGLTGLLAVIQPRLVSFGLSAEAIDRLLGKNITQRLAVKL